MSITLTFHMTCRFRILIETMIVTILKGCIMPRNPEETLQLVIGPREEIKQHNA